MLVNDFHLEVISPACDPGAERWTAKAALDDDIGDALLCLNAALKGAIYVHAARALT